MPQNTEIYWLHAMTPLHIGAGFGLGFIDLPVMREKITNWPMAPGSTVKGVLADYYKATEQAREDNPKLRSAFGKGGDESSNAGALLFSDARLVCLPARSLYGTFAWTTSGLALARLKRDLAAANRAGDLPDLQATTHALLAQGSALAEQNRAYLADLAFPTRPDDAATKWAAALAGSLFPGEPTWQREFVSRFIVLPEDSFNFLCETGTEVNARVKINQDRKTVARGALWYEESLPAETVLAGLVWCDRVFGAAGIEPAQLLGAYCGSADLQIGGKATVGRGRVRFVTAVAQARGAAR